jgi:hypothetical protein
MKLNQMIEELLETAKRIGILVRKDKGAFKSGYCVMDDKEMIILNRTNTPEMTSNILAQSIAPHTDSVYIKPVVREFIENEISKKPSEDVNIEIKK